MKLVYSSSHALELEAGDCQRSALTRPQQASAEDNGTQQLAVAVDDLLDQLQHRFTNVSNEIFGKCRTSLPVYLVIWSDG